MSKQEKIDRAEEIRKYINSKNMSRKGVERGMAVMLTHIENLLGKKAEDEKAYYLMTMMAEKPFEFIDVIAEVAVRNDELDYQSK
jgi:predicted XRE-type DNA-binding protein